MENKSTKEKCFGKMGQFRQELETPNVTVKEQETSKNGPSTSHEIMKEIKYMRMIKNRQSAARSRARKLAELNALKEENQQLKDQLKHERQVAQNCEHRKTWHFQALSIPALLQEVDALRARNMELECEVVYLRAEVEKWTKQQGTAPNIEQD